MNPNYLPCAGASRLTIKQPVGRGNVLDGLQRQNFITHSMPATVWANSHWSGGLWMAGFRALP